MRSSIKKLAAGAAIVAAASLPVAAHASDYVGSNNEPQVSGDYTGVLPHTGADVTKIALIGFGSVAGGSVLVAAARKRKAHASD